MARRALRAGAAAVEGEQDGVADGEVFPVDGGAEGADVAGAFVAGDFGVLRVRLLACAWKGWYQAVVGVRLSLILVTRDSYIDSEGGDAGREGCHDEVGVADPRGDHLDKDLAVAGWSDGEVLESPVRAGDVVGLGSRGDDGAGAHVGVLWWCHGDSG